MPARRRTGVPTAIAALACILALGACGGSSKPSHGASLRNAMLSFSRCMRAHGIASFPDPVGHGLNLGGTGIDPTSPAFRSAQSACFKLLPGGPPNSQRASAAQIRQADRTAQCMREHGVSGFPDPIIETGAPDLNPADYSSIEAGGGIVIAIPKSIDEGSPAFRDAARACRFNG